MSTSKAFPLAVNLLPIIKKTLDIESDEEASQLSAFRRFIDMASTQKVDADQEDREVVHGYIKVKISIIRPRGTKDEVLPVILFMHGGGWVVGNLRSHGDLVSNLVNQLHACVVFVDYSLSPEVKYPVALEECYAALCWTLDNAASINVDPKSLVVAGDSAGAHLCATLSILAKDRGNMGISYQILFYPATTVNYESESYIENKDNDILSRDAMDYFWDALLNNEEENKLPTVAPLFASLEHLKDLPPALIITAEKDVLRTEGELYAKKLTEAGVKNVCVRYFDANHGFLSAPGGSPQCTAALAQAENVLKTHWKSLV